MTDPHYPQHKPFNIGTHWKVSSRILGEEKDILVRVPASYDECKNDYPVLYLLDGENALFHSATGTLAHLSEWEDHLPEMIVVGIRNTNRTRDMLPTVVSLPNGRCVGGGTDAFLDFMATELIPFIEETYRTGDYRVLCGTSASALAVVYEYLTQKVVFSAYSASSPTLNWDDRLMFRMVEERGPHGLPTDAPLALFWGGHDQGTIGEDCLAFYNVLNRLDSGGDHVGYRVYESDGHCPFEGFRNSLLDLIKTWRLPDGCIEQGIGAVSVHFADLRVAHGFNTSVRSYDEVAHRLASAGLLDDALSWLEQGRSMYPKSPDIVFAQALCLIRDKREADARTLLDDAAKAGLQDVRLLQLQARVSPKRQETAS